MAATGSGVLVVEWAPIDATRFSFHVRLLDPDLGLRSVAPLQSAAAPRVVAEGRIAWVLIGSVPTPVGPEVGLPFGELADVAVARIPLDRPSYVIDHVQSLGRAATWSVNIDSVDRSYADQAMPTSSPPMRLGDRPRGRAQRGAGPAVLPRPPGPSHQVALWQTLAHVADTGQINHSDIGPPGPWVHQVAMHQGTFHAATSRGLDVGLLGPDVRTVLARPAGSPARSVPDAGGPLRRRRRRAARRGASGCGWSTATTCARSSAVPTTRSRALTVGTRGLPPLASAHGLWVPLARAGLTQLVHVGPDGEQRVVARLPGQIRPLGVVDDRLYCVQDIPVDPTHVGSPSPNTLVGFVELPAELAGRAGADRAGGAEPAARARRDPPPPARPAPAPYPHRPARPAAPRRPRPPARREAATAGPVATADRRPHPGRPSPRAGRGPDGGRRPLDRRGTSARARSPRGAARGPGEHRRGVPPGCELGADGVELDVRRTADDVLVVHHDPAVEGLGAIVAATRGRARTRRAVGAHAGRGARGVRGGPRQRGDQELPRRTRLGPRPAGGRRPARGAGRRRRRRVVLPGRGGGAGARVAPDWPRASSCCRAIPARPSTRPPRRATTPCTRATGASTRPWSRRSWRAATRSGCAATPGPSTNPERMRLWAGAGVDAIITNAPDVARATLG